MNRRNLFLGSMLSIISVKFFGNKANAALNECDPNYEYGAPPINECIPDLDFISAEATETKFYEHYHRLSIPVEALIDLPEDGIEIKTSFLDQKSLDEESYYKTLKSFPYLCDREVPLRFHFHNVKITQSELKRIASGEKNVEIVVPTPAGNLAHKFYFTATKSALIKIQRSKGGL